MQRAPRHELDAGLHDERLAELLPDLLGELWVRVAAARELHGRRQRRVLLHARLVRPHEDVAADATGELGHDLAYGGREDVHAAHDQHVVGAADAADARPGAPARAGTRPDLHVVARAEAQER